MGHLHHLHHAFLSQIDPFDMGFETDHRIGSHGLRRDVTDGFRAAHPSGKKECLYHDNSILHGGRDAVLMVAFETFDRVLQHSAERDTFSLHRLFEDRTVIVGYRTDETNRGSLTPSLS